MVLPRIANPFRAFLGRCRFESGLFRHRGLQHPGTSFLCSYGRLSDILERQEPYDNRKDGRP